MASCGSRWIYMKYCVSIKISLLLYYVFCYISYEIIIFFYISYEIIIFSSLQLTPGGVFINNCEWRHQCHFSELHRTPPSQILDPPLLAVLHPVHSSPFFLSQIPSPLSGVPAVSAVRLGASVVHAFLYCLSCPLHFLYILTVQI